MFETSFVSKLFSIPWFSECGNPILELPFSASQASSWQVAMELSSSVEWENTTLEARNNLTEFLHKRHLTRSQNWNNITAEAKEQIVFPLSRKFWEPFASRNGFGKPFIDNVQWDILAACMESAYRDCHGLPMFFHELLKVYSAGHFPCGWSGEYPNGGLYVW